MTEFVQIQSQNTLQKPCRPQIKASYSFSLNNIFPESPQRQQNNRSRSNTFSSIFSNSWSKHRRSEIYQENDEFTNGCFGLLCTLGSKIKYKINNTWICFKRRLHKENNHKNI